ncbi:hypothetical protein GALMADRAFT_229957 [Galerina marginata CBS 339.88]|uniref:Uncharacterized protein n=1 Tax=Galerina marginata (strain CBS 339.88) TaxID=685588 RepID=A0A067SSB6_GALM3|nr:hypothetical protein GALMADRAFT_229957 [Galerina marginata CBS 339.88]
MLDPTQVAQSTETGGGHLVLPSTAQEPEASDPVEESQASQGILSQAHSEAVVERKEAERLRLEASAQPTKDQGDHDHIYKARKKRALHRLEEMAKTCGCDSAIGYDSDGDVRHLQLGCEYVEYRDLIDEGYFGDHLDFEWQGL